MFDGEKCIRCDKKYTFEELTVGPAGFAICKVCATKIDKASEEKHYCPIDGQELINRMLGAVLVKKCSTCGGVWLDAEELNIFTEFVKREIRRKGITMEILFP